MQVNLNNQIRGQFSEKQIYLKIMFKDSSVLEKHCANCIVLVMLHDIKLNPC